MSLLFLVLSNDPAVGVAKQNYVGSCCRACNDFVGHLVRGSTPFSCIGVTSYFGVDAGIGIFRRE